MLNVTGLTDDLRRLYPYSFTTEVKEVRGPVVITGRLPVPIGTVVRFETEKSVRPANREPGAVLGEVTGYSDNATFVAPYTSLHKIAPDTAVSVSPNSQRWFIDSNVLGAVTDSRGSVVKRLSPPDSRFTLFPRCPSARQNPPPEPLSRQKADRICETGIRAIDGFATLACGQRIAVFAEPGVGKSTLLSTVARNAAVDVTVIALIGERGREVGDFITSLDPAVYPRTAVVQATSDKPAICRINAALTAMSVAEYFRDRGLSVLLLFDSLTRLLRAYREVGLAAGEIPVRRGYPPSVFSSLPALIERSGCGSTGSITALYTVLLSSDLDEDPMVEEIKGLTDGHIMLRRELAEAGVYPAIDPLRSLSRLQRGLLSPDQSSALARLRAALSRAERDRELAALGGTVDAMLDQAFKIENEVRRWLTQSPNEQSSFNETIKRLMAIDYSQ